MNKILYRVIYLFLFFSLLTVFTVRKSYGQLIINNALTPTQLIQNILIGSGVSASNISFTGDPISIASFSTGSNPTNLGLTSGIALTTGDATQLSQPVSYFMSLGSYIPGDADLDAISTNVTNDASVLEFDFLPLDDTIRFRYVFGSEEYPEYVCSTFNDIFAFFISGPNPAGGNYVKKNIALVPNTALPVAINTVNNGTVGSAGSVGGCTSLAYSVYYVDNEALNGMTVVFDGFTTVFTAWCLVTPCENYHIKLAIADVGDPNFDSGVFLEANSFSTNGTSVGASYTNPIFGTNAVEGCSDAIFSFTIPTPLTNDLIIDYTIGGTAINGVDYTTIPSTITIPAGQDSVSVIIHPLQDGLTESIETVTITVPTICSNAQLSSVNISDNSPIIPVATGSTSICTGFSTPIAITCSGGVIPYTYNWSNGLGTNSSYNVSPSVTTTYTVTATDLCNQSATDDVVITVHPIPNAQITSNNACDINSGSATATGGSSYLWSNGMTSDAIHGLATGNYTVTVTDNGCTSTASTTITNFPVPTVSVSNIISANCGNADGSATALASGGTPQYDYLWNCSPMQNVPNMTNVISGNYTVTVTDLNGCTAINTALIPGTQSFIATTTTTNEICGQVNGSATAIPPAGSGPYTYLWNTGANTPTIINLATGTYSVIVADANGCTAYATANVMETPGPVADFSAHPNVLTTMDGTATFFDNSSGTIVNWQWNFGDGSPNGSGEELNHFYSNIGTYLITLIVTDDNGCIDTTTDTLKLKDIVTFYAPNAFTPNGDGFNDYFLPQGINWDPEYYEMYIFDRWGNLVFQTTTIGDRWNGTINNKGTQNDVLPDVYVYLVLIKELEGPRHEYKGRITLIR